MKAFINGRIVPQEQAVVSILDRGFLYGDGLFETLRFYRGRAFRWVQHMERLRTGAEFLGIPLPFSGEALENFAGQLLEANQLTEAIVRVTISRGLGLRGYSPVGATSPTMTMTVHPAPPVNHAEPPLWELVTSSFRIAAGEALAQFKTCNKLTQVLARAQADRAGADEALLVNTDGHVVEAASSNLFWIVGERVCTPPVPSGILPGVTRAVIVEIGRKLGMSVLETNIRPPELIQTEGVFLSASTIGIAAAKQLDGAPITQNRIIGELAKAYAGMVDEETRA